MQPGIYDGIPEDQYHASPGVSKSRLKRFSEAPAKVLVPLRTTKAMETGTLLHSLLLEPVRFESSYFVTDLERLDPRTAAYKDEETRAQGRRLVKRAEYDEACRMRDAAMLHPIVREMVVPELLVEQSAYWIDAPSKLLCRGRMDGIHLGYRAVLDYKTTENAGPREFARTAANFRYEWQDAMYREGIRRAAGWDVDVFLFIAQEKSPPYLTACYEIEPSDRERGADQVCELLLRYAECERTGIWPGYSDKIEMLKLPAWAEYA